MLRPEPMHVSGEVERHLDLRSCRKFVAAGEPHRTTPARDQGHMYFDSANGVVVLYGGSGGSGILNDIWTFDVATLTWTQQANPATNPGGVFLGQIAYAPTTPRCAYLVYGLNAQGATSITWRLCLRSGSGNIADFNDDSKSDLSWRNTSTGATSLWLMNEHDVLVVRDRFGRSDLVGNAHGRPQRRRQDRPRLARVWAGTTAVWIMNGLAPTSSATLLSRSELVSAARRRFQRRRQGGSSLAQQRDGPDCRLAHERPGVDRVGDPVQRPQLARPMTRPTSTGTASRTSCGDTLRGDVAIWLMNGVDHRRAR